MPPKTKKKTKTKKKDVSSEEQERLALLQKATFFAQEIDEENLLDEQFLQNAESIKQFWEIEKKTREEKKHNLLAKEERLKELQDQHKIDLGEYKNGIKEQLFSNLDELSKNVTECLINYKCTSNQQQHEIGQLTDELREISHRINETSASHEEFKKAMQHKCSDETSDLREEASRRIASLAVYSDKQFKSIREEHNTRLKQEMKELETSNEVDIKAIMEKNKEEVLKMRKCDNATINENLDKITQLKKDVAELREKDRHDRRVLNDLRNRKNNIAIPLETNKKELQRLGSDLNTFQKQKQILDAQKQNLRRAEKELNEVEWDCEVLFQKLQALVKDRDGWKKKCNESVYTAQQRTNFQNLLLERKLSKLSMTGEKSTAAMAEILQKANIRLDTLDQSKVVITDVIREKNDQVEGLRQHLKSLKEAKTSMLAKHRRLVERYTSIATNNRDIKAKIRDKVSLIMAT